MVKCKNFFQINDWEIKKFLVVIASVQLSLIGLIVLNAIGMDIPLFREILGFLFLTFIPGFIILRILKVHEIGNLRALSYSMCLSLTFVMFMGLLMDLIYPIFGINNPLSLFYLVLIINIFVWVLCILSYMVDGDFVCISYIDVNVLFSNKVIFLLIFPFLAIIGSYLSNFFHINILLMILISLICFTVILVAYDKIPKKYFPLTVFLIALSLVLHVTLTSNYVLGWDIHSEYHFSNLVKLTYLWDFKIDGASNSVLSITTLAPIYSIILNMDLTWIFKIVYPILYCMVPLSLYYVFKTQTNPKIAFMSCMFLIFYSQFFTLSSAKQMIGELFLVALILVITNSDVPVQKNSILFILFGSALAVSHYGLSYIFIILLIIYFLVNIILQMLLKNEYVNIKVFSKFLSLNSTIKNSINFNFFLFFLIVTLAWYMYISSSYNFAVIAKIGDNILSNFVTDFMNPDAAQGYSMIIKGSTSILYAINKYINFISNFLITVGLLFTLLRNRLKFNWDYLILAVGSFSLLIFSILIPYFSSSLSTTRIYQISLLFLAPFLVIGLLTIINKIFLLVKIKNKNIPFKLISVFLVIFLLFNTGLLSELFHDNPQSIPLSKDNVVNYGTESNKAFLYQTFYIEQDIKSAEWLSNNRNKSSYVYADQLHKNLILTSYGMINRTYSINYNIQPRSYLYLGSVNIRDGIIYNSNTKYYKMTEIYSFIDESDVIYSNGASNTIFTLKTSKFVVNDAIDYQRS